MQRGLHIPKNRTFAHSLAMAENVLSAYLAKLDRPIVLSNQQRFNFERVRLRQQIESSKVKKAKQIQGDDLIRTMNESTAMSVCEGGTYP